MSLEHSPAPAGREQSPARSRLARPRRDVEPILVPILDAFAMIGVGVTKGYELVNSGRIETVKMDGKRLAVRQSLDAFVAELRAA